MPEFLLFFPCFIQLKLRGSNYTSNILSRWYRKWSAAKSKRQTSQFRINGNVVAFNISIVHLQVCSQKESQCKLNWSKSQIYQLFHTLLDHFRTVEHQPKQQMISTIGWAKCNVASSFKPFIDSIRSMHLKMAWRSYFKIANTVEHSFTTSCWILPRKCIPHNDGAHHYYCYYFCHLNPHPLRKTILQQAKCGYF